MILSLTHSFHMSRNEPEKDAALFLGLLRSNEAKLVAHLKTLLKKNKAYLCQIMASDIEGWTPFHAFALRGCKKLVKIALKSGVDVNLEMGEPDGLPAKCSALHLAAHRGDVNILTLLISNGADLNKRDSTEKTPVYYASRAHNGLAVRTLLRSGADKADCHPDSKNQISPEDVTPSVGTFCFLPFACSTARR